VHTGFWQGDLRKNSPLGRLRHRWKIILNGSTRSGMGAWTALIWLRIGTGGGLL